MLRNILQLSIKWIRGGERGGVNWRGWHYQMRDFSATSHKDHHIFNSFTTIGKFSCDLMRTKHFNVKTSILVVKILLCLISNLERLNKSKLQCRKTGINWHRSIKRCVRDTCSVRFNAIAKHNMRLYLHLINFRHFRIQWMRLGATDVVDIKVHKQLRNLPQFNSIKQ